MLSTFFYALLVPTGAVYIWRIFRQICFTSVILQAPCFADIAPSQTSAALCFILCLRHCYCKTLRWLLPPLSRATQHTDTAPEALIDFHIHGTLSSTAFICYCSPFLSTAIPSSIIRFCKLMGIYKRKIYAGKVTQRTVSPGKRHRWIFE